MAPTNKLAIADKCRFSSSSSLSSFVLPENDAIRWNNRCTMCVREFASVLCLCAFLESLLRTSKYSFDQRPSSKGSSSKWRKYEVDKKEEADIPAASKEVGTTCKCG